MAELDQRPPANQAVADILSEALFHEAGPECLLVKFITIIQYMDEDGEMQISGLTTEGLYEWDIKGLLHHAIEHPEFFIPALDPNFDPDFDEEE